MALGSTQLLTEMSARSISWGKGGRCVRLTTVPPSYAVVMKSGNLNFLGPSGPLQAYNGTALPLPLPAHHSALSRTSHEYVVSYDTIFTVNITSRQYATACRGNGQIASWHVGGCEKKGKQTNQYRNQFSVETYTMTHTMLRAPLINYGSFGTICSSRSTYTVGAEGWPGRPQSWRSGEGNKCVEHKIEDGISCVTWHEKFKCYTDTPHLRTPPHQKKKTTSSLRVNPCLSDILRNDRYS